MQVMGGIGYTNIYPVERIFRDLRLASIWTGTNEVMSMIIANEWYKQYWKNKKRAASEIWNWTHQRPMQKTKKYLNRILISKHPEIML